MSVMSCVSPAIRKLSPAGNDCVAQLLSEAELKPLTIQGARVAADAVREKLRAAGVEFTDKGDGDATFDFCSEEGPRLGSIYNWSRVQLTVTLPNMSPEQSRAALLAAGFQAE